jgi:hypothetical protein
MLNVENEEREECMKDFRNGIRVLSIAIMGLVFTLGCMSADPDAFPDKGNLQGVVYGSDGQSESGVKIILSDGSEALSDIDGRYVFPGLRFGEYEVSVEHPDYLPFTSTFLYNRGTDILYLQITSFDSYFEQIIELSEAGKYPEASEKLKIILKERSDWYPAQYLESVLEVRQENWDRAAVLIANLIREQGEKQELLALQAQIPVIEPEEPEDQESANKEAAEEEKENP